MPHEGAHPNVSSTIKHNQFWPIDLCVIFLFFFTVFFAFGVSIIPWTQEGVKAHLLFDQCILYAYITYFSVSLLGCVFNVDSFSFSPNIRFTFFIRSVLRVRFPLYMIWIVCKIAQMNIFIFFENNDNLLMKGIEFAELFFVINQGFFLTGFMCSVALVGASYVSL